ncbi:ABC transporter substrate-binding protein [Hydrogenophaga sp.]|uniref:ABC transporter substrate-binding protein n=1 Tax=Hydrogenophaga sp. TaxID=1904254 RepID=UPI00272035FF|nr:ABC transporter substrate-binding protein [Hydrogenophaga sp.]MDO8906293.1 ABC transporter substrate-binding protein [Hydrogenophaga sp.]
MANKSLNARRVHPPILIHRRRLLGAGAALAALGLPTLAHSQSGPIRIGQSAPLSGPVAGAFQGPLAGQKLAFDTVNQRGGIAGRPVELVLLDDGYDTARTVENVKLLVERDKVVALTGLGSTAGVAAVLPYLAQTRMPLVGSWTGAHVLRLRPHPTFFTSQASFKDEVEHSLRTLATIHMDTVGVAYQDNAFGELMMPVVETAAKELGVKLVARAPLAVDGSNAVDAAKALAAAKPKAVLMIAVGPSVVGFVKAARASLNVPVYTLSVAASSVAALGDEAHGLAMTQIVPSPWRKVDAMAREFNELAEAAKVPVNYSSYGGYLGAQFLLEALRRASPRVSPDSIIQAIHSIRNWSLGGNMLSFGPDRHHGTAWAEITIVDANGRFRR